MYREAERGRAQLCAAERRLILPAGARHGAGGAEGALDDLSQFPEPVRCGGRWGRRDADRRDRAQGGAGGLAQGARRRRRAAGRSRAGDGVREEFDAHPRQFRPRDPAAGRGAGDPRRWHQPAGPGRDGGGHGARPVRLLRRDHGAHRRSCQADRNGRICERAGHQRPDRRQPSLSDHGRSADHSGKRQGAAGAEGRVAGRWQ